MAAAFRFAAGILIAAGALTSAPAFSSCTAPLQPMQRIELLFGRDVRGHSGVSDAAWAKFLAREITPRFPDGLTAVDAAGQWRDPSSGRLARERSKLVVVVTADGAAALEEKIAAIVTAYKHRFHQKSVGVVTSAVCAAF